MQTLHEPVPATPAPRLSSTVFDWGRLLGKRARPGSKCARAPGVALAFGIFAAAIASPLSSAYSGGVVSGCTELSLRAALIGGGTVTFSADCTITIGQQITINQGSTTIDASGHKVIIGGSNAVPLFNVVSNLTLRGLSLINGNSPSSGGALYIQPTALVVANQCIFAGNAATGTNGFAGANGATNSTSTGGNGGSGGQGTSVSGGAIYNLGNLALVNCTLTNNSAIGGDGGGGGSGGDGGGTFAVGGDGGDGAAGGSAFGGAVYNLGNLTLINCTFAGNSVTGGDGGAGGAAGTGNFTGLPGNGGSGNVGSGGAVFNALNLSIIGSTFATNSARGGTAAQAGNRSNGTGLDGSNGAEGSGGAIYNAQWAVITNSTFFTNTVFGGAGGGGGIGGGTFGVAGDGGDGGNGVGGALDNVNTVTLVNCTFASSGAFGGTNGPAGTGIHDGSDGHAGTGLGGNIANSGGVLTLMNTILAGSVSGANIFGALDDAGKNLSSDAVSSFGTTSFQNLDPKIGQLKFNGGPTPTIALLTGSPAIDQIDPNFSPPTDQRGFPRPFHTKSDIGAFEFGAFLPATNVALSITRTTSGIVNLNGQGTTGLSYVVQASTNLSNWQSISTNIAPIQFSDPVTNLPSRFYRISR